MNVANRIACSFCFMLQLVLAGMLGDWALGQPPLEAGSAETTITPPTGFPIAGYYHERLAEGTIDPLKAKALVLRQGDTKAAMVVCDLTAISTDLCVAVRELASRKTKIPSSAISVSATHSHTAPDYGKHLVGYLAQPDKEGTYAQALIEGIVEAIVQAERACEPVRVRIGSATQETAVSFNRRFVMRDGSVQTWKNFLGDPNVVRSAGPIDPEVLVASFDSQSEGKCRAVLSNFALHLDTVGGMRWSADYPYFIEQKIRQQHGSQVVSIFGTGCCGDINHANPHSRERNKTDFIGNQLGATVLKAMEGSAAVASGSDGQPPRLVVASEVVRLPLQEVSSEQWQRSIDLLQLIANGSKVDFLDQVAAYRTLIVGQLRDAKLAEQAAQYISWGLSRKLAGIGPSLPVDVQVITLGDDLAIVFLPGEVFVDLGLAIKRLSPFKHTLVVELSNAVETAYIPTRAACVGGSYEVTNSTVQPGAGELLVDASLRLLQQAARSK